MTNTARIVFLHRGPSPYLYYVVKQARHWNPSAEIIVLSDIARPELRRSANVVPIEHFGGGAEELARIYQHHSTNSHGFELFCFQRWFILREYLAAHPAARLVHLDSDVLTFTEFEPEFARLGAFDVGIVGFQGPQSMLIAHPGFVTALCDHITRLFTEEAAELAAMYAKWRETTDSTAVSDMHALHTLLASGQFRKLDLAMVRDGSAYDGVIHEADGFAFADGQKRLTWREGQPWGARADSGAPVRFQTLHCQGHSKHRILEHFKARDFSYYLDRIAERIRRFAPKFPSPLPPTAAR